MLVGGFAAIFQQLIIINNGEEKPLPKFSKKTRKTKYLEYLTINGAVKYWQHLLVGRKFSIFYIIYQKISI